MIPKRRRFNVSDVVNSTFYQVPKFLFTEEFKGLNSDAKLPYLKEFLSGTLTEEMKRNIELLMIDTDFEIFENISKVMNLKYDKYGSKR